MFSNLRRVSLESQTLLRAKRVSGSESLLSTSPGFTPGLDKTSDPYGYPTHGNNSPAATGLSELIPEDTQSGQNSYRPLSQEHLFTASSDFTSNKRDKRQSLSQSEVSKAPKRIIKNPDLTAKPRLRPAKLKHLRLKSTSQV